MFKIWILGTIAVALTLALTGAWVTGARAADSGRARAADATAAAAPSDMPAPDAELLREYEPVLVLHPAELFQPTKIQSFVADSQLEQFVGTSPSQLPLDRYWTIVDPHPGPGELPPAAPGVLYRLNQNGCSPRATLADESCYAADWGSGSGGDAFYGRVARTDDRIVLQYWLFYYDDARSFFRRRRSGSSGRPTRATGKS